MHENTNNQVFVKCTEKGVNCPKDILSIMNKGNTRRKIGKTDMNERSSRSHAIFRITIESQAIGADSDGATQVSQLNMVDLASSERVYKTGATGKSFKEACYLNLLLFTLTQMIEQFSKSQNSQNKYFRNDKLARLLRGSLGGNAMTVMICTVTPAALVESSVHIIVSI